MKFDSLPTGLTKQEVNIKLNNDFGLAGMTAQDLQAVVAAWQANALSKDTMFELFRRGEILPDGRTNQDEEQLIKVGTQVGSRSSATAPPPQTNLLP